MPLYGSDDAIKGLLRPEDAGAFSADESTRIANLRKLASALIEYETGASFGESTAETLVVDAGEYGQGARLYLPKGIRSVASVTENAAWVGGAWSGGTALTTSDWRLTSLTLGGAYRTLTHMTGAWAGRYLIAGVWEDKYPTVPDDITYVANFIAAESFKDENTSPAGFVGPPEALVPVREALQHPKVRTIFDKYRVGPGVLVV